MHFMENFDVRVRCPCTMSMYHVYFSKENGNFKRVDSGDGHLEGEITRGIRGTWIFRKGHIYAITISQSINNHNQSILFNRNPIINKYSD